MENSQYIPKEISWLSFNERVLQEAENPNVPLYNRLKFLGIYSGNLDEFYRVRVSTLKRISKLEESAEMILGYNAKEVLDEINRTVINQRKRFDHIFLKLINELKTNKVFIINELELDKEQQSFVFNFFRKKVKPFLMPVLLSQSKEFPEIKDEVNYFAVKLIQSKTGNYENALLEFPAENLGRFQSLPDKDGNKYFIFLDDIIRFGLKDFFKSLNYDKIEAFALKLTKDAELDIEDDISESYIQNIAKSLKKRKDGNPVSFVYDRNLPVEFYDSICKKLHFKKQDAILSGGKYHNLKDLLNFPFPKNEQLSYQELPLIPHKYLPDNKNLFSSIKKRDILIHLPYHSFIYLQDLMQLAAIDPKVQSIKFTVYRLAEKSSAMKALINAAKNGKNVTVVIELQARFDEEANIRWSNLLKEEGVKVIHGVPGLKVHAKILQISREENGKIVHYAAINTGNFNENTAKVYSDLLLLTADRRISSDIVKTFNFLEKNYKREHFNHLIVSPFNLRSTIVKQINIEMENALRGKKAFIKLKVNNLVAPKIIKLLYEASQCGVEIKLIVRGMMSLVAGKKNLSENIEARGVVDMFLEHSRIFIFGNDGDEKVFISSADWMARNMDRRVEITCPVYNSEIKQYLLDMFEIQWNDNTKNRILDEKLTNLFLPKSGVENRSQIQLFEHLKRLHEK